MKKISKREKNFLWISGLTAFLLFNYLVVWSWIQSAIERQKALDGLRAEARLENEVIAQIKTWESEIKSLKTSSQKTTNKEEDTNWLRRLEGIAKKCGLNLSSQRPINEKRTAFGMESGVNYSIEAGQEALVKFLHALQNDPANPQVQILQIMPDNANNDKLKVEATIMVTRYTL